MEDIIDVHNKDLIEEFIDNQEDLDKEFKEALFDNLWDLYEE